MLINILAAKNLAKNPKNGGSPPKDKILKKKIILKRVSWVV